MRVTDEQILADLKTARQRMSGPFDWGQGALGWYKSRHGAVCALGAIRYGTGLQRLWPLNRRYKKARHELVAANHFGRLVSVANDRRYINQSHVLCWFDNAIDRVQARVDAAQAKRERKQSERDIVITLDEPKPCPVIERESVNA